MATQGEAAVRSLWLRWAQEGRSAEAKEQALLMAEAVALADAQGRARGRAPTAVGARHLRLVRCPG